ncbi:MAG TPA: class I SAM-dependent methyltransferase [Eudoraea sp.]|nr:class I SAM-dependent methyltransferase [Eudoraea sp.]
MSDVANMTGIFTEKMEEKKYGKQVKAGDRFEFGKNWRSFLRLLSDERILICEMSLKEMMCVDNLSGKSFLDIGSGSGLFSLAAKKLNARVHSIDFDPNSVKCTRYLKEKYYPGSEKWTIEEASVLDNKYMSQLPKFDIVYAWGVLHHTGNLQLALENASIPVDINGLLFIAIYNDQGRKSKLWLIVKKIFNSSLVGKTITVTVFYALFFTNGLIRDVFNFKNPFKRYREYRKKRGMSMFHDWKDWLGGLPYEVATPELIVKFYARRGFKLEKVKRVNGLGNNQFIFRKSGTQNRIKNKAQPKV